MAGLSPTVCAGRPERGPNPDEPGILVDSAAHLMHRDGQVDSPRLISAAPLPRTIGDHYEFDYVSSVDRLVQAKASRLALHIPRMTITPVVIVHRALKVTTEPCGARQVRVVRSRRSPSMTS